MPILSVEDAISITQKLLGSAQEKNWEMKENQYKIVQQNNTNIARNGNDQQKIAYYRILNQAVRDSRQSSHLVLYANLELNFRLKCKPLLNNVPDLAVVIVSEKNMNTDLSGVKF